MFVVYCLLVTNNYVQFLNEFPKRIQRQRKKSKMAIINAKDFQSLMYPCFTLCRIFGIFPYKISDTSFEISKPHFILLIIIVCFYNLCSLIMLYNSSIFEKVDMLILPRILVHNCALANFIIHSSSIIIIHSNGSTNAFASDYNEDLFKIALGIIWEVIWTNPR